jgi:hypothetical protein
VLLSGFECPCVRRILSQLLLATDGLEDEPSGACRSKISDNLTNATIRPDSSSFTEGFGENPRNSSWINLRMDANTDGDSDLHDREKGISREVSSISLG